MSEKVVLPKFDIPTERAHPAVKALGLVGALLLVSMLVLGGALWRRHQAQLAAEQQRDALIAARVAEANAVIEAAKARVAEAAAKEAAAKAKIEAAKAEANASKLAAAGNADGSKGAVADGSSGHHHGAGHHHGKATAKGKGNGASAAVAAKSDDKKSAPKSTRDNAAIDKLLAQFK
jgi:hypothetical protein